MWNCAFEELVSTDVDIAALVCCSCTWDAHTTVGHGRQAQPGTDVKLEKFLFLVKNSLQMMAKCTEMTFMYYQIHIMDLQGTVFAELQK